jgi:rhodanese-related sulfurtransferase
MPGLNHKGIWAQRKKGIQKKRGAKIPRCAMRAGSYGKGEKKANIENRRLSMGVELKRNDPARAREYFSAKMTFTTGPVELERNLNSPDLVVIDVREAEDYAKGHVPGAINLPHDRWDTLEGLRKDALNVLYCYSQQCHLAAKAAVEFAEKGFSVMEMDGGFKAWRQHDLRIDTKPVRAGKPISMAV